MSQLGGAAEQLGGRSTSPNSLKRKRDSNAPPPSIPSPSEATRTSKLTNGAVSHTSAHGIKSVSSGSGQLSGQYTSPDSDEMPHSDSGDLLRGVGSASSLNSTASSVFSHNSQAFANNRKSSLANGLTPLTNHTDTTPPKGNSPEYSKSAAAMATTNGDPATSHVPSTVVTHDALPRKERPQMLPPSGKAKGYKVVWDPELDSKLSREERKRAQVKRREFGTEVRYTFHNNISLSLHKNLITII